MSFRLVKLIDPLQIVNIPGGLVPRGAYDNATNYAVGDSVDYLGSSYVMFSDATAGTLPTDTDYWQVIAEKGDDGANGADGGGVAVGGTTDQLLAKASGTDFDTKWVNKEDVGTPESLIIAYSVAL